MSSAQSLLPGVPLVESPLFHSAVEDIGLTSAELAIAVQLNEQGFALIDFPDAEIEQRIERIKRHLAPGFPVDLEDPTSIKSNVADLRMQDAWTFDDDVRRIAANEEILDLLSKLYGRRSFPFQTLNFPVGTQQSLHSDSIHFSSVPERFMCGVWLAFEDVSPDAGPLVYLPGSHKWPILSNSMLGRTGAPHRGGAAQDAFQTTWDALVDASNLKPQRFLPKKGQALIWAANLLHGGDIQNDPTLTRWSQVTHYYFEDCVYYTPAFSDEPFGDLDLRVITNIDTGAIEPNSWLGKELPVTETEAKPSRLRGLWPSRRDKPFSTAELPSDFDAATYKRLNPDVAAAGHDAARHYLQHGRREGRRYRTWQSS
jgi:hypothetical protein